MTQFYTDFSEFSDGDSWLNVDNDWDPTWDADGTKFGIQSDANATGGMKVVPSDTQSNVAKYVPAANEKEVEFLARIRLTGNSPNEFGFIARGSGSNDVDGQTFDGWLMAIQDYVGAQIDHFSYDAGSSAEAGTRDDIDYFIDPSQWIWIRARAFNDGDGDYNFYGRAWNGTLADEPDRWYFPSSYHEGDWSGYFGIKTEDSVEIDILSFGTGGDPAPNNPVDGNNVLDASATGNGVLQTRAVASGGTTIPTIIDDFEDGDVSEYREYDDNDYGNISTSTTSYEGTYSADIEISDSGFGTSSIHFLSLEGEGLDYYPDRGKEIVAKFRTENGPGDIGLIFGANGPYTDYENYDQMYFFTFDMVNEYASLGYGVGGTEVFGEDVDTVPSENEWFTMRVNYTRTGSIGVTVENDAGTTTYFQGDGFDDRDVGTGFGIFGGGGDNTDPTHVYVDDIKVYPSEPIVRPVDAASTGTATGSGLGDLYVAGTVLLSASGASTTSNTANGSVAHIKWANSSGAGIGSGTSDAEVPSIAGTVTLDGSAQGSTDVVAVDQSTGHVHIEQTNASGEFEFLGLDPGYYHMYVPGYSSYQPRSKPWIEVF